MTEYRSIWILFLSLFFLKIETVPYSLIFYLLIFLILGIITARHKVAKILKLGGRGTTLFLCPFHISVWYQEAKRGLSVENVDRLSSPSYNYPLLLYTNNKNIMKWDMWPRSINQNRGNLINYTLILYYNKGWRSKFLLPRLWA